MIRVFMKYFVAPGTLRYTFKLSASTREDGKERSDEVAGMKGLIIPAEWFRVMGYKKAGAEITEGGKRVPLYENVELDRFRNGPLYPELTLEKQQGGWVIVGLKMFSTRFHIPDDSLVGIQSLDPHTLEPIETAMVEAE